jgi:hypothetical protein
VLQCQLSSQKWHQAHGNLQCLVRTLPSCNPGRLSWLSILLALSLNVDKQVDSWSCQGREDLEKKKALLKWTRYYIFPPQKGILAIPHKTYGPASTSDCDYLSNTTTNTFWGGEIITSLFLLSFPIFSLTSGPCCLCWVLIKKDGVLHPQHPHTYKTAFLKPYICLLESSHSAT